MITVLLYELRRTLRSPWFYVSCFLLPAIILLSVKLPEFIVGRLKTESKGVKIIIVNKTKLGELIKKELENDPFIDNWEIGFKNIDKKNTDKRVIHLLEQNNEILVKMEKRNEVYESVIKRAIENSFFIKTLSNKGMSRDEIIQLKQGISIKFLTEKEKTKKGASKYMIMMFLIVFYISIMGYGELLAHRVMTDKETNFINILLLYRKPEQIFTGKLLAVVIGYLIYLIISFGLTLITLKFIMGKGARVFVKLFLRTGIKPELLLVVFVLFFVSFIMYSSFYLLSGAIANSEDDLKGHSTIINFVLIAALIISSVFLNTPDIGIEHLLFYLPPVTPFLLLKDLLFENISKINIVLGFSIIIIFTIIFVKLASLKYKVSSLCKSIRK
jgi:ABC-type Na+ efflux pump permease subunit